ncbi:MAG: cbb3-type cytochrome c oxidase subunit I [Bacillota bacterium]
MYQSQRLALLYFGASLLLFGVMIVAGLMAAFDYIHPSFLFDIFNFNMSKIIHIDMLVIWLLLGFMGAVYWFLPQELNMEVAGVGLGKVMFWLLCLTLAIVAVVFIVVQTGSGNEFTLWFVNQGRKYVEAPRWASILVVLVMLVFAYNVIGTAIRARRMTGLLWVLIFDLVPLVLLYLDAFPAITNMSHDLYWWWWLVHMWVEATWEVLIGCLMAWVLMDTMGTSRRIVEAWLYIEVMLVLGTGILGLGHHYFWIGTPRYWLSIGGFFSALEPLPLLGMVVHAVYDAGAHHMKTSNRPAYFWVLAEAFGNFIGAGVWGFMMTLPQINLFSHGTQWTVSHGHFAFWGAYACGVISIFYLVAQKVRKQPYLDNHAWRWGFGLLNFGMIGMVGALLIAGIVQAFFGRAMGGSTLQAFVTSSDNPWFVAGMYTRFGFGVIFALGYAVLVYDLLTTGKSKTTTAANRVPA